MGDDGDGVAVDAAENSYVTGFFSGAGTFDAFVLMSAESSDIIVVKYAAPPSAIPTVPEWGLVVMSLLILTAGTLVHTRGRSIQA